MDSVVNSSTLVSIGRNVGQHFSENVLARFGPESLAFLNRNDWLLCSGLGGVFGPECALGTQVFCPRGKTGVDPVFEERNQHRCFGNGHRLLG